jgi:hypothetical protein
MNQSFVWSDKDEELVLMLREQQHLSFKSIAHQIGITEASAKHKYRRLTQARGDDRYHHPKEKIEQVNRILPKKHLNVLELHAGWGNLTRVYQTYGTVLAYDIDADRVAHTRNFYLEDVDVEQGDSILELHGLVHQRLWFDVVDLDPYGMPSRYFPHVFQVLRNGWLFMTFPKIGVQKINKITIEHLRVFWDINLGKCEDAESQIVNKVQDLAMQSYRSAELIDLIEFGRMWRFAFKVEQRSALELVGLTVNRNSKPKIIIEDNLFTQGSQE